MAKTCILQPMKAVGTLFGGPPIVRHFDVSANVPAAGGVAGDVVCYDQSAGKIDVADFDSTTWLATTNLDQIDDDKLTAQYPAIGTWLGVDGDSLPGILMGDVTASQTAQAPVAMFGSSCVFEANLTSWADGDTVPTALASLVSHVGRLAYIASVDVGVAYTYSDGTNTAVQTTKNGLWVLSDTQDAGTTALIARIIRINLDPNSGVDVLTAKGVTGDLNARVHFIVTGPTFLP